MSLQVLLETREDRARAVDLVSRATQGLVVEIREPRKTSKQNRYMHKLLERVAAAGIFWAEREWTPMQWKAIFICSFDTLKHGEAEGPPLINDLEGGVMQVRRSWSDFGRGEANEFLSYLIAFCEQRGLDTEPPK